MSKKTYRISSSAARLIIVALFFNLFAIFQPAFGADGTSADSAMNYLRRGAVNASEGDYAVAIMNFNMAVALKPDYAPSYYMRGLVYDKKGDRERAMADFTAAIDHSSRYAEPHLLRAMLRMKTGDTDSAIADFDKAIKYFDDTTTIEGEKNIGRIRAHIGRGHAYGRKGDLKRAIKDYEKAIEMGALESDLQSALVGRGIAHLESGDDAKAQKDFNLALAFAPDDALAHYNIGRTHARNADKAGAEAITEACHHLKAALGGEAETKKNLLERALVERDFDALRDTDCFKEIVANGADGTKDETAKSATRKK